MLIFKTTSKDHLAVILGVRAYATAWDKHAQNILDAFQHQTSLKFTQKQITIRGSTDSTSYAGTQNKPMQLYVHCVDDVERLGTLTHELGHRLLAGNGLYAHSENEDYTILEGHKRLYLFLYDVWSEAFGQSMADKLKYYEIKTVTAEGNDLFKQAWDWALSRSYQERQADLAKLRQPTNRQ